MVAATSLETNVFINCPFDAAYLPLLRPLLFSVVDLGFIPRIASERSDSTESRVDKIVELIRTARISIHDISRLRSTSSGEFSRFNLPFELGLAHGSRVFGPKRAQSRRCLILEKEQHDFRHAISDLSGVDIKSHGNQAPSLVRAVRNWFVETVGLRGVRSPTRMWYRFSDFASDHYDQRKTDGFSDDDLTSMPVPEYLEAIRSWVAAHK